MSPESESVATIGSPTFVAKVACSLTERVNKPVEKAGGVFDVAGRAATLTVYVEPSTRTAPISHFAWWSPPEVSAPVKS